jgi:hypothetical protein
MTGNVRVRKSWDALGGCCCGAAIAEIKKILRGHMVVLLAGNYSPLKLEESQNPKWEMFDCRKEIVAGLFAPFTFQA